MIIDCEASNYNNIELYTIAQQLLSKSDLFLCYDETFREHIELEGVVKDKLFDIEVLNNFILRNNRLNLSEYFPEQSSKTHFLCNIGASNYNEICQVIQYLSILNQNSENDYVLNLVGRGTDEELKRLSYFVYDLGVKENVRLFQNASFDFKVQALRYMNVYICSSDTDDIFSESYSLLNASHQLSLKVVNSQSLDQKLLLEDIIQPSQGRETGNALESKHFLSRIAMMYKEKNRGENITLFYKDLFEANEFSVIISNYESVINKVNKLDKSKVLLYAAASYYGLRDYHSAERLANESIMLKSSPGAHNLLGKIFFLERQFEDSLRSYKESLSVEKDNVNAIFGIVCVYERTGLFEEAIIWLEKCLYIGDEINQFVTLYARICLELSDVEFGIHKLQDAIGILGEKDSLLFSLGKLYLKYGDKEKKHSTL